MNHIIHDVDRDGWGSAALLIAELTPSNCRLYPTREKDVRGMIQELKVVKGDTVWVLDIPGPQCWCGFTPPDSVRVVWVDHHLESWKGGGPPGVEIILPNHRKPTTTMSVLTSRVVAEKEGAARFARSLCSGNEGWGAVFDGLLAMAPDVPLPLEELARILAQAPGGVTPPDCLAAISALVQKHDAVVHQNLTECRIAIGGKWVVAYLEDAHGISLGRHSLQLGKLHPGKVRILVHRRRLIYCGRDSRAEGLDLVRFFKEHGLTPKGHGYVCYAEIAADKIETVLQSLCSAIEGFE